MALFKKNQHPKVNDFAAAITASGSTYRVSSYQDSTSLELLRQEWQERAYAVYDTEGELYYATNYIGSALSKVKLVAAKRPIEDGAIKDPEIISSGPIYDAVRGITSSKSGQSGLLRQLGKNIFLAGEAWMYADVLPNGQVSWNAVSIDELVPSGSGKGFQVRKLPGAQPINLPQGTFTVRIWKEHPRYSELADAGTRSCMELLEKIIILNRAETAIARSRLAGSGILALPQELVPPGWQNQSENANPMESNPLWQALAESMTAPLKDGNHPSAVVPLLLVGPGEVIKNMKYEPLAREFDTDAAQKSINNAIQQIANTLDLPKEVLLGTGEATHWTAWAIKEDTFEAHIKPMIELVCEALTHTYLQRALQRLTPDQLKSAGVENASDVMVWYDATDLIVRTNKSDDAMAAHDRIAISDEGLRKELGMPEEYKPNEDEYAKRVGLKVADPGMALTGKPTPPPAPMAPAGGAAKPKGGGGPLP